MKPKGCPVPECYLYADHYGEHKDKSGRVIVQDVTDD
jgi:hypothetical protein